METKSVVIEGDDGGFLEVLQTPDSDMHIVITPSKENGSDNSIRFRTFFGGGHSEGVRLALRNLMIAIEKDPKCTNKIEYAPLAEYKSLSAVPLDHPEVKYRCLNPSIHCGDAVGDKGCLGKDHKKDECPFMVRKDYR